jgi:hypothetical protein
MRADELLNGTRRSLTSERVFGDEPERDRGTVIPTVSISGGKGCRPSRTGGAGEASGCVAGLQSSTCCGRERSNGVRAVDVNRAVAVLGALEITTNGAGSAPQFVA